MGKDRNAKTPPASGAEKPFNNPFGSLEKLRDGLPSGPEQPLVVALEQPAKGPARAVIRLERKGHGGKEVTLVEKLELSAAELERWSKELKQQLGCGGSVEGDALLFQGDQRARLKTVLAARGVRKVVG
jgi:translation initiation factor 1